MRETLESKGYLPIPVAGKVAVGAWKTGGGNWDKATGTAIVLGSVVCVDIDVRDDEVALALAQRTVDVLGPTVIREGAKGCGLLYHAPEPFAKVKTGKQGEAQNEVEFLAKGQYVVVDGAHPSGCTYECDPTIEDWPNATDLPVISEKAAKRLCREFKKYLELLCVPADDYDEWVRVGAALHHEGYNFWVWDAWSRTADNYGGTEKRWDSFRDVDGGVTEGTLRYMQKENDVQWRKNLIFTDQGAIKPVDHNVIQVLRYHPDWMDRLAYDTRAGQVVWNSAPPFERGVIGNYLHDSDALDTAAWFQSELHMHGVSRNKAHDALNKVSSFSRFDPFVKYLESLEWDGVGRLDTWLQTYLHAEDSDFVRAVGRRFMISAVARAGEPGCKVDTVLVLVGAQEMLKSSALEVLAVEPRWFKSTEIRVNQYKDVLQGMKGPVIYELQEIDKLTRRGDYSAEIKSIITGTVDKFRPAYGREEIEQPRRSVFCGTTNHMEFLSDETGGRRFWPVECPARADLAGLRSAVDQLWAEAVVRWVDGEQWWLTAEETVLAQEVQRGATHEDPWCELLRAALRRGKPEEVRMGRWVWDEAQVADGRLRWVTLGQALRLIGKDAASTSSSDGKRMLSVLQGLGCKRGKRIKSRGLMRDAKPWYLPPELQVNCKSENDG